MPDLINIYETEEIKKRLPKFIDNQKEFTGMPLRNRILICGGSGTGKTNALMNYIHETSKPKKGSFKHIFLMYKTDEPAYESLIENLKKQITVYKNLKDVPFCSEFDDKPKGEFVFIFDDCVNDIDKASMTKVKDYFTYSRQKGITCIFLTQSYFQTNIFVRAQMNFIVLLSIKSSSDLTRIIKEYELPDVEPKQVQNMFLYCTQKNLNFFKIDTGRVDADKKFSKNFIEYIQPKDFNNVVYGELKKNNNTIDSDSDNSVNETKVSDEEMKKFMEIMN